MRRSPQYRWIILAIAFLSVFGAIGFGRFGYSAVLPAMQEALGLTSAATILVGAGQSLGPYLGGLLGDAFGSLGPAYLLSAGVYLLGSFAALALPETRAGRAADSAARPDTGQVITD